MSVAYVITFDVRPAQRKRFLALLGGVLDAMRHEATYRDATLHEDPDSPNRFLLHEVWADHDDVVTVQLSRPYRRAWHEALPDLLAGDRVIAIWRPVDLPSLVRASDVSAASDEDPPPDDDGSTPTSPPRA